MSAATAAPTTEPQSAPATSPEPTTAPQGNAERTFTQTELDTIVLERIERERRSQQREQEQRERQAEEARLAANQEHQQLSQQRGERIVELEAVVGQVESLTTERDAALTVVRELVAGELEAAPDYVRDAIAERGPVEQLRYLNQHRDKWTTDQRRGIPPTPRGAVLPPEDIGKSFLKGRYGKPATTP